MKIDKETLQGLVDDERESQTEKWGQQFHADPKWYLIAAEEFGEVAKAQLEYDETGLLMEIVQVMAVLEAWVTSREWHIEITEGEIDEIR